MSTQAATDHNIFDYRSFFTGDTEVSYLPSAKRTIYWGNGNNYQIKELTFWLGEEGDTSLGEREIFLPELLQKEKLGFMDWQFYYHSSDEGKKSKVFYWRYLVGEDESIETHLSFWLGLTSDSLD